MPQRGPSRCNGRPHTTRASVVSTTPGTLKWVRGGGTKLCLRVCGIANATRAAIGHSAGSQRATVHRIDVGKPRKPVTGYLPMRSLLSVVVLVVVLLAAAGPVHAQCRMQKPPPGTTDAQSFSFVPDELFTVTFETYTVAYLLGVLPDGSHGAVALVADQAPNYPMAPITVDGHPVRVVPGVSDRTPVYRVIYGPFDTKEDADRAGKRTGLPYWVYEGAP